MLSNYLTIAFRNLSKYKVFSLINIIGMAISLASCLLISIFVADELSYDKHIQDADRKFRVYNIQSAEEGQRYLPIVPYGFAPHMKADFPEIEETLRIMDTYEPQLFSLGGKKTQEANGIFAESSAFDMLSIKIIYGEADSVLGRPLTVALSESLSKKYFGDKDPVGQSIKIDGVDREITGVFADVPEQSHLRVNYMITFKGTAWEKNNMADNFRRQQIITYLKLKPETDAMELEKKFVAFNERHSAPQLAEINMSFDTRLQKIKDVHLHSSNFEWEIAQRGDAQNVYILIATAIMILGIACLNFINLSTARAVKRMKEVGIRKTTGAQRGQLIVQFLSESMLFTFIGLSLAIVIAETALPLLNLIIEKNLDIPLNALSVASLLLFCVVLGALAGGYPAVYLSNFRPAVVLSRKNERSGRSGMFRQSLVVVQFMLSFFLISASLIVLSQNELIQTKDLGFNKEHVIMIPLREPQLKNQEVTKQQYKDNPNIISATIAFGLPGDIVAGDGVQLPGSEKELASSMFCVDEDYISTMGMKIIAGRDFSRDFVSDSADAFIVNESFLETYGFPSPEESVGSKIDWKRWDRDNTVLKHGNIVGVVKDFHFKSLREKLSPVVMQIFPKNAWRLAVRISGNDVPGTIEHLRKVYEKLDPNWTFSYKFMDENLDQMYKSEQKLGQLFTIFTYLAIFVACLGLYGLVEYSVNQRSKEISIRKVFGASVASLVMLLTKRYFLLLCISCLLIIPLVIGLADQWLNRFAYQIHINSMLFIKAGGLILFITAFTVSFQSIRAALSNPVNNLRNE
jgi:putative ABC transport system permease protein